MSNKRLHRGLLPFVSVCKVRRAPSCGNRPFCEMEGMFAWNLVMAVPLSLIGVSYTPGQPVAMNANFYKTLASASGLSLVECELITGRTHQIRAQFAHAGHPLLGDGKYGKLDKRYDR